MRCLPMPPGLLLLSAACPQLSTRYTQYLFLRHGGKVVFFGRFIAVLRILAAFLAGVNRMPWRRFFLANAAGAIAWTTLYGLAAYLFGAAVMHVRGPIGIALLALGILAVLLLVYYVR